MTSNDQPPAAAATPPPVQLGVATTPESPARTRRRDSAWKRMVAGMRPQLKASQFLAGILCAVLGFALVVQVRASASDQLAGLRQEDLVRLLDDVTTRADQLETEASRLQQIRDELATSTDQSAAAQDLANQRAATEGILSGRLPATGPGLSVIIVDSRHMLRASQLFNILEEMRNAGAEAVQVNNIRLTTSTSFVDTADGIEVDGQPLTSPFNWLAIGNPATIDIALEIPGGALPSVRADGATAASDRLDTVTVDATVRLRAPEFARPLDDSDNN